MPTLALVLADPNSHSAGAPGAGVAVPIIVGILVVVLAGGWAAWRVFSNRTKNVAGEHLADPPDVDEPGRFAGSRDPERERVGKPL